MAAASMIALVLFDIIVCSIEIPKMLKQKLIKELITFSILLLLGTVIGMMKSLDMKVPNPSDFLAWVYSPVSDLMKSLAQP
jgi:glucan phosphoethanolaminetransferase (alkaline phosphatase superfamily)